MDDKTRDMVDAHRSEVALKIKEADKAEQIERENRILERTFAHDYKVAIVSSVISAALGAFLSEPLWNFIRSITGQG